MSQKADVVPLLIDNSRRSCRLEFNRSRLEKERFVHFDTNIVSKIANSLTIWASKSKNKEQGSTASDLKPVVASFIRWVLVMGLETDSAAPAHLPLRLLEYLVVVISVFRCKDQ